MDLQQLRDRLSAIEPDHGTYAGIGPDEIPLLQRLLKDREAWMAARAVFALAEMHDPRAAKVLLTAAVDSRPEVRIAVAACAIRLEVADANRVLASLLADREIGVRKFAIRSVTTEHDPAVQAQVRHIQSTDPVPAIRRAAERKLTEMAAPPPR